MTGLQITAGLRSLEDEYQLDIGHTPKPKVSRKIAEYNQFPAELRAEAAKMSELYEVFYCLENSIRQMVEDILLEVEGVDWWSSARIDQNRIRSECENRRNKEINSGITPRSENLINYTTFGELSQIITDNWDVFGAVFTSKSAVSNVTNQLNLMRGAIAHCSSTDDMEQERLSIAVRSWFRLIS
ncbi:Swt1 family HEPN domain-containing protein [Thalassospira sp.]|uniref:Swt1 family HEPN domain-containing protein n=1 Tax=Thalassospira sp. TaxID=1912094 RepID=UPI00311F4280